MRSSVPGGLRAQVLIGLTVLLVASFALGATLVENVLTRRLLAAHQTHLSAVATAIPGTSDATRKTMVEAGVVDAVLVAGTSFGPTTLTEQLDGTSDYVTVGASTYLVVRADDVVVAAAIDDVRNGVAGARTTLLVFGLLLSIVVLALGFGLFSFVVVRPIRAIGVATERAAQGDLASPITVVPRNEIGRVAMSFNEMLRRLETGREALETKVAELEASNAALEATRDSLVRSEKLASVGQLAAGIAHEIGNPLAALSGYNELLRDGELDDAETEDLLRRSSEQLDRIRTVIRNLLDFSRDESGMPPGPTDIGACVDETVSLVRAGGRGRRVDYDVGDLAGPLVCAVPSQVVQVLVNLALNAADAVGEGGRVEFRRTDDEQFCLLSVEDDGPGVPEHVSERIFDPFFTTKDPGDGTGLGLAISARIAESLGGSLTLEPRDLGARFVLRLPHIDSADEVSHGA